MRIENLDRSNGVGSLPHSIHRNGLKMDLKYLKRVNTVKILEINMVINIRQWFIK